MRTEEIAKALNAVRENIINDLKSLAVKYGKESDAGGIFTIDLDEQELYFVQTNTEDIITSFNNEGGIETGNIEDKTFEQLSTDLLFTMLKELEDHFKE